MNYTAIGAIVFGAIGFWTGIQVPGKFGPKVIGMSMVTFGSATIGGLIGYLGGLV